MMPTWDEDTYSHVDVVAADQVFTDINEAVINTEVRSIPITRRGVYLAFYDQGACTTLISVRIFYHMCPSMTSNLAIFPNTTTGAEITSLQHVAGICVAHAVQPVSVGRDVGVPSRRLQVYAWLPAGRRHQVFR